MGAVLTSMQTPASRGDAALSDIASSIFLTGNDPTALADFGKFLARPIVHAAALAIDCQPNRQIIADSARPSCFLRGQ